MTSFAKIVIAGAVLALSASASQAAGAKNCFKKAAVGNALTEGLAQFQVDAALLQAVDWSIYGTWVTGNGTPGYSFGPRTYKCEKGSVVGWQCRGSATLCKLN